MSNLETKSTYCFRGVDVDKHGKPDEPPFDHGKMYALFEHRRTGEGERPSCIIRGIFNGQEATRLYGLVRRVNNLRRDDFIGKETWETVLRET